MLNTNKSNALTLQSSQDERLPSSGSIKFKKRSYKVFWHLLREICGLKIRRQRQRKHCKECNSGGFYLERLNRALKKLHTATSVKGGSQKGILVATKKVKAARKKVKEYHDHLYQKQTQRMDVENVKYNLQPGEALVYTDYVGVYNLAGRKFQFLDFVIFTPNADVICDSHFV